MDATQSHLITTAFFDTLTAARSAVEALHQHGFPKDSTSLIAYHHNTLEDPGRDPEIDRLALEHETRIGAAAGGTIGALTGLFVGVIASFIPGIGPVLAAGPIVGSLIGVTTGAAGGSIIGGLIAMGISEHAASHYAEGLRRGGVMLLVASEEPDCAEQAATLLTAFNPVDLDARAQQWARDGDGDGDGDDLDADLDAETPVNEDLDSTRHRLKLEARHLRRSLRRHQQRAEAFGPRGGWVKSVSHWPATRRGVM